MWLKSFKVKYRRSWLFRHLTWVLIIKILLLTVLWHTVVKPQKQRPTTQAVSKHLLSNTSHQQHDFKEGVRP